MANQDVVLNIVAKADSSTVQSEFGQMAQQLSRVFDQALEGIGNKLAEVILRGAQAGMRGIIVDPSGRPIQAPQGVSAVPPMVAPGAPPPPVQPPMAFTPGGFADPFAGGGGYQPRGIVPTGMTEAAGFAQAARLDALYQQARVMQSMRGADMDPNITPQQREQFREAQEQSQESLRNLQTEIQALNSQLAKATENLSILDESMRQAPDGMKEGIRDAIQEERRNIGQRTEEITRLSQAAGVTAQQAGTFGQLGQEPGFNFQRAGMIAGTVGGLMQIGSQMPMALRQSAAARAEMENMEARALMRGDVERLVAQEQLGGREDIMGRARRDVGLGIGGRALAGVAGLAGGLALGPLGLPIALGGAALLGRSALDIGRTGTLQQENVEAQIQAQMGQQAELMQMTRMGRQVAVQGFRGAQAMGAPEMAGFMQGQTMRQFAMQQGLSPEMLQQFLSGTAQMGGTFLGQAPTLMRPEMMPALQGLMRAQSQGLAQAPEIAGGLFQAGGFGTAMQQQQQAMQMTRDVFEDAVAGGLDKAAVGRALMGMSQRAEQLGFGGQGQARMEMEQAVGVAQRVFGPEVTGPQLGVVQGIQQQLMGAAQGTGGAQAVGGLMGVRRFARQMGFRMSAIQEEQMRQMGSDPEFMRQMIAKQRGVPESEVSMEEARQSAGQLRNQMITGVADVGERLFGAEGGMEMARRAAGVKTGAGMMALKQVLDATRRGETGIVPGMTEEEQQRLIREGGAPTEMVRGRVQEQLEAARVQAPGAQLAQALSSVEMQQVAGGLNNLGNVLPQINDALNKLVERANAVLSGQPATPKGPTKQVEDLLRDIFSGKNASTKAGGKNFLIPGPHDQSKP